MGPYDGFGVTIRAMVRNLRRDRIVPKNGNAPFEQVVVVLDTGEDFLPRVKANLTEAGRELAAVMEHDLRPHVGSNEPVTIRVSVSQYGDLYFRELLS
ncbi:MAG: hypothetical protein AB2L09_02970 [Coriobacteriia bacterium]